MLNQKSLQIVTLESPADQWSDSRVQELFCQIVNLKLAGYGKGYQGSGHKVLAVDGTDLIGVHQLICEQEGELLQPLLCYRTISVSKCEEYNMTFPFLTAVMASKSPVHIEAVQNTLKQFREEGLSVWYDSAFTIDPRIKGNAELELFLFQLLFAIGGLHRQTYHVDRTFVLANEGFKTDKLFKKMGSRILKYQDKELDSLVLPFSGFNKHKILVCNNSFSIKCQHYMEEFRALWDRRLVITANIDVVDKAA